MTITGVCTVGTWSSPHNQLLLLLPENSCKRGALLGIETLFHHILQVRGVVTVEKLSARRRAVQESVVRSVRSIDDAVKGDLIIPFVILPDITS